MTNSLVNNVTNMTLLIGLPAIIWGMSVLPSEKGAGQEEAKATRQDHEINRLSLLLTLTAVLFFTGADWVLGRNGRSNFSDGLVLVGLFLFWQCFHVFDVLKTNVRQSKAFSWMLPVNLALAGRGRLCDLSQHGLAGELAPGHPHRFRQRETPGLAERLADGAAQRGCWRFITPGAGTRKWFTPRRSATATSASRCASGSARCIRRSRSRRFFQTGIFLLLGATLLHIVLVALFGRLPRLAGFGAAGGLRLLPEKGLALKKGLIAAE